MLKRKERIAIRRWIEFLYDSALITYNQKIALLDHYKVGGSRRNKTGKTRIDDSVIKEYLQVIERLGFTWLKNYLLGGSRLEQIIYMLNHWKPDEVVEQQPGNYSPRLYCSESFCRYYLGEVFGRKRVDYIYIVGRPKIPKEIPGYRRLKDKLNKHGVKVKVFREYVNQRLEELAYRHNIRLDAVNLILSRELSVTGAHYLDTLNYADKLFSIYVEQITKTLNQVK